MRTTPLGLALMLASTLSIGLVGGACRQSVGDRCEQNSDCSSGVCSTGNGGPSNPGVCCASSGTCGGGEPSGSGAEAGSSGGGGSAGGEANGGAGGNEPAAPADGGDAATDGPADAG